MRHGAKNVRHGAKNVSHGAKNVRTVHFSSVHYSSVQCSSVQCTKTFIYEARESNKHLFVCVYLDDWICCSAIQGRAVENSIRQSV